MEIFAMGSFWMPYLLPIILIWSLILPLNRMLIVLCVLLMISSARILQEYTRLLNSVVGTRLRVLCKFQPMKFMVILLKIFLWKILHFAPPILILLPKQPLIC